MRYSGLSGFFALLLFVPVNAAAQPVGQRVEGTKRVCTYKISPVTASTREYRIGVGEACPVYYPIESAHSPLSPTARLTSATVVDGKRICRYSQRSRKWTFTLPLDQRCPPTAGMFQAQDEARNPN